MKFWCCWEVLEETNRLADAFGMNCVIRRVREDKASSSQLVVGAWKSQVHGVDLTWKVFCYSCTPTHSLVDRFTA